MPRKNAVGKKIKKNNAMPEQNFKRSTILLLLGILTLIVMLLMAYNNSPLIQRFGEDGGMYLLMGRNLAEGGTLYKDLFDHKGPIIFFLNALPQLLIKGSIGVWFLEVIFMVISLVLIYKMAYRVLKNVSAILIPMIYLWLTSVLFNGGNYTEEYGNLFCIISLYIIVDWIESEEKSLHKWQAYVLGICMSFVFFMRPNNIAVIAVIIAFVGIYTLRNMPEKAVGYSFYCLLGLLSIVVPLLLYHYQQGTIVEMFNATVIHNLKYCKAGIESMKPGFDVSTSFKRWGFFILIMIIYAFIRCKIYKDKLYAAFLGCSVVVTFLSIGIAGREFKYYLILAAPIVALACILILKHGTQDLKRLISRRLSIIVFCMILIMAFSCYSKGNIIKGRNSIQSYKEAVLEMGSFIPENDRDQVFGFDIPAMWFYVNDIMPCYHYFTMQTWMSKSDPSIREDINEFVVTKEPKWIVTYDKLGGTNILLAKEIEKNYEKVTENISGYLYRRVAAK